MEIKNQFEEIKQFEIELRELLQKEKLTVNDAAKLEIMVYVASQSRLINMEDVSPNDYLRAREFFHYKATERQQLKLIKIYELLRTLDTLYRSCVTRGNAIRFIIERIDGVAWSLQQCEHIENALLKEHILPKHKIQKFADKHLNSLSSKDSVELYKERLESISGCVQDALCFYPIYKETMLTIAKIYKYPFISLLIDDWDTFLEFKRAPIAAKQMIKEHIQHNAEEKIETLNNLFDCLNEINNPRYIPTTSTINELRKSLKLESAKPNPQYFFCMMDAVTTFAIKE